MFKIFSFFIAGLSRISNYCEKKTFVELVLPLRASGGGGQNKCSLVVGVREHIKNNITNCIPLNNSSWRDTENYSKKPVIIKSLCSDYHKPIM